MIRVGTGAHPTDEAAGSRRRKSLLLIDFGGGQVALLADDAEGVHLAGVTALSQADPAKKMPAQGAGKVQN
jgi:hypothetical protein